MAARYEKTSNGEDMAEILQVVTSKGDTYKQASIKVQALSEEKRTSICEELINHFLSKAPTLSKMISMVHFEFAEPHPYWPTSPAVVAQKQSSSSGFFIPTRTRDMQFQMKNQNSGDGFEISTTSDYPESLVYTMDIYKKGKDYE